LSNHYQTFAAGKARISAVSSKNRIDLSHTDPVLQHFKSKKVLFHQTKPSAFCTLLKKPKFHLPISQKPFKILNFFLHI